MNPVRTSLGRCTEAIVAVFLALALSVVPSKAADENILLNPNLSSGSSTPNHWRPSTDSDCDSFQWFHAGNVPAELRIHDIVGQQAWLQGLNVAPGWYHFSASLRTEGLGHAFLAVQAENLFARSDWSAKDWERHGLYVHLRWHGDLAVLCGLDSPTHHATAFFRDIILTRVSGSPPADAQEMEIDQATSNWLSDQRNLRLINISLISLLFAVGLIYFRYGTGGKESGPAEAVSNPPQRPPGEGWMWSLSRPRDRWRIAPVVVSFALLLLMFIALSRIAWVPGAGFSIVEPAATMSDEPYYILLVNSLLFDHEFEVQKAYDRVSIGGAEAGRSFRGLAIDHHSILVNRRTGQTAFTSTNVADSTDRCDSAFNSSKDTYEVSAHPVAFPAVIALAIAPFRPSVDDVERDASLVLALIAWLGALLTFLVGRRTGMGRGQAMLAAMLLVFASPWLAYSRSFFSESTIGLVLIFTVWAFTVDRIILAGFSAGFAAILKPPFAVVGAGLVINEFIAGRPRNAAKLLIGWASCGMSLVAFNYWLAKTPVISGNLGLTRFAFYYLYDTFLDPVHGLFYFAPWTIFVFLAIPYALRSHTSALRLVRQLVLPLAFYIVLLDTTGPGLCYGPRYWVPFLPWFALATIQILETAQRPVILACAVLVLLSALIAIPGALRYSQMFSTPPWAALR